MMASIAASFSTLEKKIICDLVEKYKDVVENKRTDSASCESKKRCWINICSEFNCNRDVVQRDDKQLKRCWEKLKTHLKKQKMEEMRHRMGTGGGSSRRFEEDPITAQVEMIVSHLDEVIEETFDSDYHYLVGTSKNPFYSSSPIPTHSPSHSSPSLSPTHPYFTSTPATSSSSSTIRECRPSVSLASSATATTSTATGSAIRSSSSENRQPRKKAKTTLTVVEEELEARLASIEEEQSQRRELHQLKMKTAAEELAAAVAKRKLAEAQLQDYERGKLS